MPGPVDALRNAPRPAIRPKPRPEDESHAWPAPRAPATVGQFAPELMDAASRPDAPPAPLVWDTRQPSWLQHGGPSERLERTRSQEGVVEPSLIQAEDLADLPKLALGLPKIAGMAMGKGGGMAAGTAGAALLRHLATMERKQGAEELLAGGMPDYMVHRAPMRAAPEAPLPSMPPPGPPNAEWVDQATRYNWNHEQLQNAWSADNKTKKIQRWLDGVEPGTGPDTTGGMGPGGRGVPGLWKLPTEEVPAELFESLPPISPSTPPTLVPPPPGAWGSRSLPPGDTNPGRKKRTP